MTLDLSRGTPVAGTVTWADGEPAIGVPVVAEHEEQMRGAGRWSAGGGAYGVSLRPVFEEWGGGPEEVTGPEGAFTLRGLPPGRWRLSAQMLGGGDRERNRRSHDYSVVRQRCRSRRPQRLCKVLHQRYRVCASA